MLVLGPAPHFVGAIYGFLLLGLNGLLGEALEYSLRLLQLELAHLDFIRELYWLLYSFILFKGL